MPTQKCVQMFITALFLRTKDWCLTNYSISSPWNPTNSIKEQNSIAQNNMGESQKHAKCEKSNINTIYCMILFI